MRGVEMLTRQSEIRDDFSVLVIPPFHFSSMRNSLYNLRGLRRGFPTENSQTLDSPFMVLN